MQTTKFKEWEEKEEQAEMEDTLSHFFWPAEMLYLEIREGNQSWF